MAISEISRRWRFGLGWLALMVGLQGIAAAHFGAILPSDDMVMAGEPRALELTLAFFHPFEQQWMDLERPRQFGVLARGKRQDLLSTLSEVSSHGASMWVAQYPIRRPGDHVFYMEPSPYFEPAEGRFIVHYTKVVVHALGLEVGWDERVGFPTEIIPLTRPYGLWTGNVFQGVVWVDGKPAAHQEVEVEYDNVDGVTPPASPFITQVIKTDTNGVFTYAIPHAGWWGFAALSIAPEKRRHTDGKEYEVERGAVLWVHAADMQ